MAAKDYDDQKVENGLTERERETLPVWAQERMASLRRTAETAERRHGELFDSQEPTRIAYGDVYGKPRFLPDGLYDRINFSLDGSHDPVDGSWVSLVRKQDHHTKNDYIEVSGSDGIAVVSQAYNVIRIYPFRNGEIDRPDKGN